jgi:hypothetical protein
MSFDDPNHISDSWFVDRQAPTINHGDLLNMNYVAQQRLGHLGFGLVEIPIEGSI